MAAGGNTVTQCTKPAAACLHPVEKCWQRWTQTRLMSWSSLRRHSASLRTSRTPPALETMLFAALTTLATAIVARPCMQLLLGPAFWLCESLRSNAASVHRTYKSPPQSLRASSLTWSAGEHAEQSVYKHQVPFSLTDADTGLLPHEQVRLPELHQLHVQFRSHCAPFVTGCCMQGTLEDKVRGCLVAQAVSWPCAAVPFSFDFQQITVPGS